MFLMQGLKEHLRNSSSTKHSVPNTLGKTFNGRFPEIADGIKPLFIIERTVSKARFFSFFSPQLFGAHNIRN